MLERIEDILEKIAVAIYLRVSTEDQRREGHSLETQYEDAQRRMKQNTKWYEAVVYQDVESGYEIDRPGYQQMLRDAQAGKFQVLIIWKLDRLGRNTLESLRAVDLLTKLGIEIVSAMDYLDYKSARGKRNLREDLVDAEFYRDRLIENVMPGMIRGVKKGNWQGARYPFYGYGYDKRDKRLFEISEEIKTIKIMYSLRASSMAIYSICKRIYDLGIRNRAGRLFTTHQVEIILKRTIYVDGHLEWGKKERVRSDKPVVTPIIDRETWEKVQAVNRERSHEAKSVTPGRVNSPYVLQGVLKCAFCGGNMVGQRRISNHAKNIKVPWYVCGQYIQRTRKACRGQCVRADAVHELAFEILKQVLQNPQLIQLTREHLKNLLEYSFPHLSRRIRDLRSMLQRLEKEIIKCREAYYQEALTVEQFKVENHRLLKGREEAEKEVREIEVKLSGAVAYQGKVDQVFGLLNNFEPVWLKMAPVQQRVVYRGIFNHFYVESRKYSREYRVKDFSLKEPFESWYHNRTWEGPLLIQHEGQILSIKNDNQQKDKELWQKFIFAPSAVK